MQITSLIFEFLELVNNNTVSRLAGAGACQYGQRFMYYNVLRCRRVMRDIEERGRDLETVLHQYTSLVKPAFEEFCIPTKKYADVIIPRGAENTVAIDLIKQHIQDLIFRSAGANKTESNCHERSRSNSDSTNTSR